MTPKKIQVAKYAPTAVIPSRQHDTDAGYDLNALNSVHLGSGQRKLIRTGISIALPAGYVGYITPRSGLAHKHGVTVLNAPGTIDAGYRGELKVNLINHGRDPYTVKTGDRIAQLVIQPIITPELEVIADNLLPTTSRGENGHGSTGTGVTQRSGYRVHRTPEEKPDPVYEHIMTEITQVEVFDGDGIRHSSTDARGAHVTLEGRRLRVDHFGTTQRHYEGWRKYEA